MSSLLSVKDWMSTFEAKLTPYLEMKMKLSDEEATKLGRKDTEAYPFLIDLCTSSI